MKFVTVKNNKKCIERYFSKSDAMTHSYFPSLKAYPFLYTTPSTRWHVLYFLRTPLGHRELRLWVKSKTGGVLQSDQWLSMQAAWTHWIEEHKREKDKQHLNQPIASNSYHSTCMGGQALVRRYTPLYRHVECCTHASWWFHNYRSRMTMKMSH